MENQHINMDYFIDKEFMFSGFDVLDNDSPEKQVVFILNNVTFKATEDECDGYRSSLRYIMKTSDVCKNTFPSHKVKVGWKNADYGENHTLDFVDVISGKSVMQIGTDNWDDYYPYCVMSFMCLDLAINCANEEYVRWQREYKLERITK